MDNTLKMGFFDYVTSEVNLDALEKLTEDMDKDIEESQKLMDELKSVLHSVPKPRTSDSDLLHEEVSKFLEADEPNLLLPDMCDIVFEIDLDNVIANMKSYIDQLKEKQTPPSSKVETPKKDMNDLDLDQYAFSLDQLGKRLANIKLTQKEEVQSRNPELEGKLTQLCDDINYFAKLVQAKTRLTECNKNCPESEQPKNNAMYEEVIARLMSGTNDVLYLLQQNRNKC